MMLLNVPYALDGRSGYLFSVFLYSAVFLVYAICRVMKYQAVRNRQQAKLLRRQYIGTSCGVAAALLVLFCVSTTAQARSAATAAAAPDGLTEDAAGTVQTTEVETVDDGAAERAVLETADVTDTADAGADTVDADAADADAGVDRPPAADADSDETAEAAEAETVPAAAESAESPTETERPAVSMEPEAPEPEETPEPTPEPTAEPTPEPTPEPSYVYQNGTFSGTADGFEGAITV
ncbi:MAG: hypothetical protein LUE95_00495, partial [Oscillospiraceae bacterium]|nr:hypothetical protein [Oscillospiraceae bacterium]